LPGIGPKIVFGSFATTIDVIWGQSIGLYRLFITSCPSTDFQKWLP
jgi:hypothetical protein